MIYDRMHACVAMMNMTAFAMKMPHCTSRVRRTMRSLSNGVIPWGVSLSLASSDA